MTTIDDFGVPVDDYEGKGWYPQYRRSQRWARAEYPEGYDVELPGRHAWDSLTTQEREEALPSLFHAYWYLLHDEDNERRLDVKADDGSTYLQPGNVATLWDYATDKPNEHDEVRADRRALINALSEIELLQHRLARWTDKNDSGESK